MPSGSKPYTFDRVFRIFMTILVFAAVLWLMNYLSDVLIPFAAAFLLAYLLNPLVNLIQKNQALGCSSICNIDYGFRTSFSGRVCNCAFD